MEEFDYEGFLERFTDEAYAEMLKALGRLSSQPD
jgi:hypothetical protein